MKKGLRHIRAIVAKSIITKVIVANSAVILAAFLIMAASISTLNYNRSVRKEQQMMVAYLTNALNSVDNKLKDMARVSLMSYSDGTTQDILENIGSYSFREREESLDYLQRLYSTLIIIREDINGVYIFNHDSLVFRHNADGSTVKSGYDIASFIRWMEEVEERPGNDVARCKLQLRPEPGFLWNRKTTDPFEQNCIYMIREVKRFSPNDRIGHILLVSPVSVLREVLLEFLDPQSSYLLVGEDGVILCSENGGQLGQTLGELYPDLSTRLTGAKGAFVGEMGGENNMISYERSSFSRLMLITAKPMRYIYRDTVQFICLILVISLVLMTAAVLLSGRSTRRFIIPIRTLSQSMESFGKGNTRINLPVTTEDESGRLTRAFNLMVDTINDLIFSEYEATIKLRTAQLRQKEAQLLYLRSQINPHFLYNTLDNIRIKAAINGDGEVAEMILLLVDFFRFSMGVTSQQVPIRHELRLIQVYLRLMRYRYPGLEDVYEVDDALTGIDIPSFVLQPLVENSLLHGLKSVSYRGRITVRVLRDPGDPACVLIEIADNGTGLTEATRLRLEQALDGGARQEETERGRTHIGVRNVQQRLKMFYPQEQCGLSYRANSQGGVTAVIRIRKEGAGASKGKEEPPAGF